MLWTPSPSWNARTRMAPILGHGPTAEQPTPEDQRTDLRRSGQPPREAVYEEVRPVKRPGKWNAFPSRPIWNTAPGARPAEPVACHQFKVVCPCPLSLPTRGQVTTPEPYPLRSSWLRIVRMTSCISRSWWDRQTVSRRCQSRRTSRFDASRPTISASNEPPLDTQRRS
jgi:hypothetical protein